MNSPLVEVRCNTQGIVTDPSGGGRRRVVANFPILDSPLISGVASADVKPNTLFAPVVSPLIVHVAGQGGDFDAPGVSVISVDPTWGSKNVPLKSDMSVVSQNNRRAPVISGARTWDSNVQSRDDRSLSGQRTASGAHLQSMNV